MDAGSLDGFVFDETVRKKRVSDEEIVRALKRFASKRGGRAFSMVEFDRWAKGRPCRVELVRARFGGWRAALERAGVRGGRCGKYSAEQLMEILEFVWRKTKMPPTEESLHRIGKVGIAAYARIWGSHMEARARLAKFRRGEISREVMMAPVGSRARERGGERARVGRRGPLPVSLRWRVLLRDGQRCVVCGASARDGVRLEVDHVKPVCRGGGDGVENLRTLCWACNRGKGKAMSDVGCGMSDVKARATRRRGRAA